MALCRVKIVTVQRWAELWDCVCWRDFCNGLLTVFLHRLNAGSEYLQEGLKNDVMEYVCIGAERLLQFYCTCNYLASSPVTDYMLLPVNVQCGCNVVVCVRTTQSLCLSSSNQLIFQESFHVKSAMCHSFNCLIFIYYFEGLLTKRLGSTVSDLSDCPLEKNSLNRM